tara:strand:- start:9293 stop:9487 length:195 start_codon:yes stop_codon:yes gene_type:complete
MDAIKIIDLHLVHLKENVLEEINVIDRQTELINDFSSIYFVFIDNYLVENLRFAFKPYKDFLVE